MPYGHQDFCFWFFGAGKSSLLHEKLAVFRGLTDKVKFIQRFYAGTPYSYKETAFESIKHFEHYFNCSLIVHSFNELAFVFMPALRCLVAGKIFSALPAFALNMLKERF